MKRRNSICHITFTIIMTISMVQVAVTKQSNMVTMWIIIMTVIFTMSMRDTGTRRQSLNQQNIPFMTTMTMSMVRVVVTKPFNTGTISTIFTTVTFITSTKIIGMSAPFLMIR